MHYNSKENGKENGKETGRDGKGIGNGENGFAFGDSARFDPMLAEKVGQLASDGRQAEAIGLLLAPLGLAADTPPYQAALEYARRLGLPSAILVLAQGPELHEDIKNSLFASIGESIRFAGIQRRNLKDDAAYNRHIEKVLEDICFDLALLFELGCGLEETAYALGKYLELTMSVNTPRYWNVYWLLARYGSFCEYADQSRTAMISAYERGSLVAESLSGYILDGDIQARDAVRELYEECLEDDPARAAAIRASGLLDLEGD